MTRHRGRGTRFGRSAPDLSRARARTLQPVRRTRCAPFDFTHDRTRHRSGRARKINSQIFPNERANDFFNESFALFNLLIAARSCKPSANYRSLFLADELYPPGLTTRISLTSVLRPRGDVSTRVVRHCDDSRFLTAISGGGNGREREFSEITLVTARPLS